MSTWRRLVASVAGIGLVASVVASVAVISAGPAGAAPARPSVPATPAPAAVAGQPGFHSVVQTRVLDTRHGLGAPAGPVGPGRSIDVQFTGVANIPDAGVAAVVFNLTAVAPTAGGFLTVYPAGATRPNSSNLNFTRHQTIADEVIATVGTGGKVTIFNAAGDTHVLVDVTGWFATDTYYHPLTPFRALDTRSTTPVGPGGAVDVPVTGRAGIPTTASAVAFTLTATHPTTGTFVTAYLAGQPRPHTSNLNLTANETTAVLVVTKLDTGGKVTLYNDRGTVHLVADVTGWFTVTGQFTPVTPTRIFDTRTTGGPLPAGASTRVMVAGSVDGTIPSNVNSVVLSVTAVAPTSNGFLTVQPSFSRVLRTSTLNVTSGRTTANMVITPVGSGAVFVANGATSGSTDVVVDVLGWFVGPFTFTPPALPDAALPAGYTEPLTASGGAAPYTWAVSAGTLPTGLSLAPTGPRTAAITGTPTTPGTSTFTIRVTESRGIFLEESFTLTVRPFVPGAVWALGGGGQGQLGAGGVSGTATPLRVHDLSGVTAISAGFGTGYALRNDGTVWAWGINSAGRLGD